MALLGIRKIRVETDVLLLGAVYMHILWDPYESIWYTCQFLNDIVIEFPESHNAICYAVSRPKNYEIEHVQMDSIASLRGVFLPK